MSKGILVVTRGLPASGKTTRARDFVSASPGTRVRVNRDDLRAMMFGVDTDYGFGQEQAVTVAQQTAVRALLQAGAFVITDDTNLRPKYVREWRKLAKSCGAEFRIEEFPIDPEEAIRRDAARDRSVGEAVIRNMVQKFTRKGALLPIPDEPPDLEVGGKYEPRRDASAAILVDIDGTLAHNTGGRDIYDLTRVSEDTPNLAVIEAVWAAANDGLQVVYMSGRDELCREDTAAWLQKHVGVAGPLYMRPTEKQPRRDSIIKRELFDKYVRDVYNVRYVLDDRNQVVEMWRSLGLTVFQVADGDF